LLSDTEDDGVFQVRVTNRGSEALSIKVEVQGVPAYGIVDSAADITIMGGKFFTILDLASGYWQIRVEPGLKEKTAFVTPHGLFQFRVTPFGLTNSPAVFQRLTQSVLMGQNLTDGNQFVSVYIDDVLIYSRALPENLEHLKLVIQRIERAGLKLKPSKCSFVREEVGSRTHPRWTEGQSANSGSSQGVSQNVKEVRQFLAPSLHYH